LGALGRFVRCGRQKSRYLETSLFQTGRPQCRCTGALLLSGEQHARELSAESEAIAEAIKLLAPGISRARKEYSRKVAEQRGEEYQAIVERIVDAAKALGDAFLVHHEFINSQGLDGVSWRYFRPLNLDQFGNLDEPTAAALGKPPKWMTEAQASAWRTFEAEAPWLNYSHRALV